MTERGRGREMTKTDEGEVEVETRKGRKEEIASEKHSLVVLLVWTLEPLKI